MGATQLQGDKVGGYWKNGTLYPATVGLPPHRISLSWDDGKYNVVKVENVRIPILNVRKLTSMGFDRNLAVAALRRNNNDVSLAVEELLQAKPPADELPRVKPPKKASSDPDEMTKQKGPSMRKEPPMFVSYGACCYGLYAYGTCDLCRAQGRDRRKDKTRRRDEWDLNREHPIELGPIPEFKCDRDDPSYVLKAEDRRM